MADQLGIAFTTDVIFDVFQSNGGKRKVSAKCESRVRGRTQKKKNDFRAPPHARES